MKTDKIANFANMDGWEALGNAVVVQAAEDYCSATQRLKLHPHDEIARKLRQDAWNFFHDPATFAIYSDADPKYIFDRLCKEGMPRKAT